MELLSTWQTEKNRSVLKAKDFNAEAVVKLWEAFAGAGEEMRFWNALLSEKLVCFLCFWCFC